MYLRKEWYCKPLCSYIINFGHRTVWDFGCKTTRKRLPFFFFYFWTSFLLIDFIFFWMQWTQAWRDTSLFQCSSYWGLWAISKSNSIMLCYIWMKLSSLSVQGRKGELSLLIYLFSRGQLNGSFIIFTTANAMIVKTEIE